MRSEWALRGVFIALFALTLYLMYVIFRPFLAGIAWAVVLVVAFQPVNQRLARLLRGRSGLAAIVMSVFVAAVIVVPAVIAAVRVGQGAVQGYHWLETQFREGGGEMGATIEKIPGATKAMEFAERWVDLESLDLKGMVLSAARTIGNALAGKTADFVSNAVQTILTFAVMLVTMAVLFHRGENLVATVRRFLPLSEKDRDEVFREMREVTRSVFFGVLLTALVQGVVGGIGTAIVGLPSPVTFAAAMFFCALLPAGTAIVWLPAALWLFATDSPWKALFLVIWGVAAVGSIDNFLRPLFIGRGVRMHVLLVFFGIFGGMLAFGLVGLFVGPLIITFFLFLVEVARRDFLRDALRPGDGEP